MNLTFFNHYGVGDLIESREFVKDWMKLCGVRTARYAHRPLPGFFADLPGIESVAITEAMDMRRALTRTKGTDGTDGTDELWVNTWIGRDGRYVVNPGIGCTVEGLYWMHNDLLKEAGLPPLPRTVVEYIPTIDYTRIDLGNLHTWLDAHRGERLVLVCNGKTGSGQAENFDLVEAIRLTGPQEKTTYLFTEPIPDTPHLTPDTFFFTDKLTQRDRREVGAYGPCDFNALSYLSRFCDVIIGRCSGPQMAANVLPNWLDSTKTLVSFTHHQNGSCFVLNPEALGLRMKRIWSGASTAETAAKVLEKLLCR
ncbi:MAG: hypothetical protein A2Y38_23325 [Spirochaetes bacterium GWB1_59_5]|nr:MAG: hypothetical protein A2Y38_23325 [Spirochaetes bacterium GWB1_59_5]